MSTITVHLRRYYSYLEHLSRTKQIIFYSVLFFVMVFIGIILGSYTKARRISSIIASREKIQQEEHKRIQDLINKYDVQLFIEK